MQEMFDVENFTMPTNRLLTAAEVKILKTVNIEIRWVKCNSCGVLGATTDNRECCSLDCTISSKIEGDNDSLLKSELRFNDLAQPGDYVKFKDKIMKVFCTDCTLNRLNKNRKITFSYILILNGKAIQIKDLEEPLQRIKV